MSAICMHRLHAHKRCSVTRALQMMQDQEIEEQEVVGHGDRQWFLGDTENDLLGHKGQDELSC